MAQAQAAAADARGALASMTSARDEAVTAAAASRAQAAAARQAARRAADEAAAARESGESAVRELRQQLASKDRWVGLSQPG